MSAAATAFAALALLALPAACGAPPRPPPTATAPAVVVFELDRGPVDPLADPAARATVLLFTRRDCPISNRYAPEIAHLHAEYAPRGVAFFLVYVDPGQTDDEVRAHVRDYGYPCRVLLDPGHQLVALAGATITPEAALYLPGGRRAYRGRIDDRVVALDVIRPQPTRRDLAEAIDAALAGRAPEVAETPAIGCVLGDLRPGAPR